MSMPEINRRTALQALGILGASTLMMDENVLAEEKTQDAKVGISGETDFFRHIPLHKTEYEHVNWYPSIDPEGNHFELPGYIYRLSGQAKEGKNITEARMTLLYRQRMREEQMQVLASAAADRNVVVVDRKANGMTLRLLSLMKTIMRRNSHNKEGRLTDIILPQEVYDTWTLDTMKMDSFWRRQVFLDGRGRIRQCFGVNIHSSTFLNPTTYIEDELCIPLLHSKTHFVIGLDRFKDKFIMPEWYCETHKWYDATKRVHRIDLQAKQAIACLDNRHVLFGQI